MRKAVGPPGAFEIEPNLILEEISHPGVSLEDWTRQALSKLKRDFPSLRLIDVAQTHLGGVTAHVIWATRTFKFSTTQIEYLLLTEESGVILVFTCSSADFSRLSETFAKCAQSLEAIP